MDALKIWFMLGTLLQDCSAVKLNMKGTLTSFLLAFALLTSSAKRESVTENSPSCLPVNVFIRQPCLPPTVKISQTCTKDDIHTHTHCVFNINHFTQPSCKTDVREYDSTMVVPSRRLACLWTWIIYLALFSNVVTFSGCSGVIFLVLMIPEHLIGQSFFPHFSLFVFIFLTQLRIVCQSCHSSLHLKKEKKTYCVTCQPAVCKIISLCFRILLLQSWFVGDLILCFYHNKQLLSCTQ